MVILCTALTAGIIILFSPSVKNKFWIIFVAVVVGLFALSTSTVQGIIIDSIRNRNRQRVEISYTELMKKITLKICWKGMNCLA